MKAALALIGLAALTTPAFAQFEPLQFAVCKKISTDADRLKCFDAIGPKPKTADEEDRDPTPVKGKWVYRQSKSPIDDSDQIMAVLAGDSDDTLLVLRCQEKRTDAILVPPAGFYASGRASVLIRLGTSDPETVSMSVGTNGRSLFASPAPEFMRLLPDNSKLFMRATGFQGKQADATFNLADVSVARDKIASTCNWTTPKADRGKLPDPLPAPAPAAVPSASKPKPKQPAGPLKLN